MASKKPIAGMEAIRAIKALEKSSEEKSKPVSAEDSNPKNTSPLREERGISGKAESSAPAGAKAVAKARAKEASLKMKTIGFRVAPKDLEIIQNLASKLMRHGLQYSEANAIRVAVRSFGASDSEIAAIAQQILQEDGRRNR